jgi:2-phosphosulfolactate phosphatase
MKIFIHPYSATAQHIKGFTIVVDVFRAFTVSYFIMQNNPSRYIITNSVGHAFELKKKFRKAILVGEREGVIVPGFDYGNSPTAVLNKDFRGCTVIHTTTAGTKGVLMQPAANLVVAGSFVNEQALIDFIRKENIDRVNLQCTAPPGWGDEDILFAVHFKKLLQGEESDFDKIVQKLKNGSGLRLLQSATEPASDFYYCMERNRFNTILTRKTIPGDNNALELVIISSPGLPPVC